MRQPAEGGASGVAYYVLHLMCCLRQISKDRKDLYRWNDKDSKKQ